MKNKKPIIIGFVASLSLLSLYFLVLSFANSFSHAAEQFYQMWYWIVLLTVGFGVQVGLYSYLKINLSKEVKAKGVAASGGVSAGSMIACCLHHVVDVLPLIGLAAFSLFLARYQLFFIVVGILSNVLGIVILLEVMQKNGLFSKEYNMSLFKKVVIGSSLPLLVFVFFFTGGFIGGRAEVSANPSSTGSIVLESETNTARNISFEVSPITGDSTDFEIKINTHSGSLDFDLVEVSYVEDYNGIKYDPLSWQGSPPGGHHRSGTLVFPRVEGSFKLFIKDDPGYPARVFEWTK